MTEFRAKSMALCKFFGLENLGCGRLSFAIGFLGVIFLCPCTLIAAADPAAAGPMVTLGKTTSCEKGIFLIRQVLTCPKAPLDDHESMLMIDAFKDLNRVLASTEFKRAVLAEKFDPSQTVRDCPDDVCNKELSPEEIYALLLNRSPIKVDVTIYTDNNFLTGNQGFEDDKHAPGIAFGNRKAIQNNQGFLASLMLHEIMHILGFRHLDKATACKSVPYSMNRIYGSVSKQLGLTVPGWKNPCG